MGGRGCCWMGHRTVSYSFSEGETSKERGRKVKRDGGVSNRGA